MKKLLNFLKIFIYLIIIDCVSTSNLFAEKIYSDKSNQSNVNSKHHNHQTHNVEKHSNLVEKNINNPNPTNQDLIISNLKNNSKTQTKLNDDMSSFNHPLKIVDDQNKVILEIEVAIADSPEKRNHGLMNLKKLPINKGMIFLFDYPQVVNFWMKDTLIPLDILFINKNHQIIKIHENSKPLSLETISSNKEIKEVIEINAGLAKKYNLKIGNKIIFN